MQEREPPPVPPLSFLALVIVLLVDALSVTVGILVIGIPKSHTGGCVGGSVAIVGAVLYGLPLQITAACLIHVYTDRRAKQRWKGGNRFGWHRFATHAGWVLTLLGIFGL